MRIKDIVNIKVKINEIEKIKYFKLVTEIKSDSVEKKKNDRSLAKLVGKNTDC